MGFISTVFCRKRCICLVIPCIVLGVVTWFAIFHRELAYLRATFNPKYQKNADETVVSPNDTENHKSDFEYRDDSFREHDLFHDKNSDSDYNDDYDQGLILEHHHDDNDYHGNDYHGHDRNNGLSDNENDDGNHLGGDHDDETHSENGNEMENDPEQENGNDNDSDDNSDHDHEHNEHLSNSDENENNSDNENDDANHSDNENSEDNQSGNNDGGDNTSDNEGHSDNFHGNEHGNDGDSHSNHQEHDHNNDDDDHGNEHGTAGDSHSNDQTEHNNDDDDHGNEHGNDGDSHSNDRNEHNNDDDDDHVNRQGNDGESHSNDQNEHDNDDGDHGNEHSNDSDSHSNDQNQHNNDDGDADSESFPDIFGLERSDDFIDIETENNHIIETLPDIEKHSDSMNTANDAINNILDSALDKVNQHKHPDDQENRAPPASVTPSPNNTVGGGEALDAHMSMQKVSTNDEIMKAEQLKDQTIDVSTASIRAPSAQTKSTATPPGKLDDKQLTIDDLISSLIDEKGDDNASTLSTTTKPHINTQIYDVIKGITDATTKQPNTPNRKQEITAARIQSSTPTPSDTPLHFTIADDKQPDPNVHNLNDRHEVVDPLRDDTSEENDKKESITFEKNENNRLGSLPVTSTIIDKA